MKKNPTTKKDRVPVKIHGEFTAEHAKQLQLVLLNIHKRIRRENNTKPPQS